MITVQALQESIAQAWKRSRHGSVPAHHQGPAAIAKLTEEVGEVAQLVLVYEGWSDRKAPPAKQDFQAHLHMEIGDVLFVLARLADLYGIDLQDAAVSAVGRFQRRLGG